MTWQFQSPLSQLRKRAFLMTKIREFFAQRRVLEVQTPILSRYGNTDVQIEAFTSQGIHSEQSKSYLRTSPEFFHKRLLASGSGDIFELAPVFRHGEATRLHNPEFTLLEWYRQDFKLVELMDEVVGLVFFLSESLGRSQPGVKKISYQEAFLRYAQIDPFTMNEAELNEFCTANNYGGSRLSRTEALDFVFAVMIQPQLDANILWLLFDFPVEQAALAQVHPKKSDRCLRFELIYQGVELANGYQELSDSDEQRRRFQADLLLRSESGKLDDIAIDEHLLAALSAGLPSCSGVAVGIERLHMCLVGADSIQDVMGFNVENS